MDTKALDDLNKEIVKLIDELSTMNEKQARLKELVAKRSEIEQQLLGTSAEPAPRRPGGRRGKRQEQSADTQPSPTPAAAAKARPRPAN